METHLYIINSCVSRAVKSSVQCMIHTSVCILKPPERVQYFHTCLQQCHVVHMEIRYQ